MLIYLNDHPWAQLTALNVLTIAKLMVFLYLKPFEDEGKKDQRDCKPNLDFDFCVNLALLHRLGSKYTDQTVFCIRTYVFVASVCTSHGLISPFENAGKT